MSQKTSRLDDYQTQIEAWVTSGKSYRSIAKELETSEASIRRAVKRWKGDTEGQPKFDRPGLHIDGDDAEVTSDPRAQLSDKDSLIRERNLDPKDWEVSNVVINEYGPVGEEQKQLKLFLKRKKRIHMLVPARVKLDRNWSYEWWPKHTGAELVVFVGDQHAPFQNQDLHRRFCHFLNHQKPERGVLMGDTVDYPNISRHADEPAWRAKTQECLDSGCQMLVDYRTASEKTAWVKLPGNHEERMRRAVIDNLSDFYGLKPAQVESLPDLPPIHDPAYLLRLDELGIELIEQHGSYKFAKYVVSPHLAAKHGDSARKGSGATALGALAGLDHSVIMGHTHRQGLVQRTVEQINGPGRLLQAGETGCMCLIEEGLGYAPGPDWSNGFITAAIWPDGTFKLDLATYVDNHLYWRSERY